MTSIQIVTGFGFNLLLQLVLLLVMYYDMLESPLNAEVLRSLLSWRTLHGHDSSRTNPNSGKSLVQDVCEMDVWNFETESYKNLYDYLQLPMPGWSLSGVGIALWILTMAVEFRFSIDQLRLLFNLPTCSVDGRNFIKVNDHY